MGFLTGKRAVIIGLASNRSIAYGIAGAMRREGAELAFNYQSEKLQNRVEKLAGELGSEIVLPLDVASDAEIDGFFEALGKRWDHFDILVHSVAFAPADLLDGRFVDTVTREGFRIAHDISSFSLAALAQRAAAYMSGGGALLTLTYLGALRTLPNYNVMGLAKASLEANMRFLAQDLGPGNIRVNAISAGPIRTLAASGVKGIRDMLAQVERSAPLKRNVGIEEVGNAAAFLCSDLASGITGQVLYVDAGYSIIGMPGAPAQA